MISILSLYYYCSVPDSGRLGSLMCCILGFDLNSFSFSGSLYEFHVAPVYDGPEYPFETKPPWQIMLISLWKELVVPAPLTQFKRRAIRNSIAIAVYTSARIMNVIVAS